MSDRELLEWAAKAAGYPVVGSAPKYIAQGCNEHALIIRNDRGGDSVFDPLTDDGDALRLAVKLRIEFYEGAGEGPEAWAGYWVRGVTLQKFACEPHDSDPYAATRRAIVSAAAEIGKAIAPGAEK